MWEAPGLNRIEIAVVLSLLLIGAAAGYAATTLAGANVRTQTVTSTSVSVTTVAPPTVTIQETSATTVTQTSTLVTTVVATGPQQPFILLNSTSYVGTQHIAVVGWVTGTSGAVVIFVTGPANEFADGGTVNISSTGYFQALFTTGGPYYQVAGTYVVNATSSSGVRVSTQFLYQP